MTKHERHEICFPLKIGVFFGPFAHMLHCTVWAGFHFAKKMGERAFLMWEIEKIYGPITEALNKFFSRNFHWRSKSAISFRHLSMFP
jgi:hypothetical protein